MHTFCLVYVQQVHTPNGGSVKLQKLSKLYPKDHFGRNLEGLEKPKRTFHELNVSFKNDSEGAFICQ